ncbi:MAG: MMPL family transporter [Deltaproteobacteria bacterium]|nr:MMPL family transporter [Deltaproteobacteria bacterium]
MLGFVSKICSRFPLLVILGIAAITGVAINQITTKLYFEADMTKFLPKDMMTVKSDDYAKKNFYHQEKILIGLKNEKGNVLDVPVLRSVERMIQGIKNLKGEKTFKSMLTGKEETIKLSLGFDLDNILSIANLEDAILDQETGSVVSGSVIKKLKEDHQIPSVEGKEELLPEKDEDLLKLIPELKERVLADRNFRGSILSEDLSAATINVSMVRKWDYKKRYTLLELRTALDEKKLKQRYMGQDSTFPFTIYGKTINGITLNDNYIKQQVQHTRKETKKWLMGFLGDSFSEEPQLKLLLDQEMTLEVFNQIINYVERTDFFMNVKIDNWLNFVNYLWEFTIGTIDPFSLENLNFQLFDVKEIYDLNLIYELLNNVLAQNAVENVSFYIAGQPVVLAVFSHMMSKDMQVMVPLSVLVILLLLGLSYRSARGVVIPLLTVITSVIWTLGLMAVTNTPLSITTTALPIVLLAVGTAYGIHLLNRYYEDAATSRDKNEILQRTMKHVGLAVVMAAITTMAGFSSLASSSLDMIKHFGIFSAMGVGFALIISLTLTPALLKIWILPRSNKFSTENSKTGVVGRYLEKISALVIHWPKSILLIAASLFVLSLGLMTQNYFEGSMMTMFKKDNMIYQSDQFLNKNLTGTSLVNLIFEFRDNIQLDKVTQQQLKHQLGSLIKEWNNWVNISSNLDNEPVNQRVAALNAKVAELPESLPQIQNELLLLSNILNEEYYIETQSMAEEDQGDESATAEETDGALDELEDDLTTEDNLDSLSEDSGGLDDLANASDSDLDDFSDLADESENANQEEEGLFADLSGEQINGLKSLHQQLNEGDSDWQASAVKILNYRSVIQSDSGKKVLYALNLLDETLTMDIKQPIVLHKLEGFYKYLKTMQQPEITIDGQITKPTGFVFTPVDFIRKFYKVFYHDDQAAFDRLPDVKNDGFEDQTLTDRAIIGVVLDQAMSAKRDTFESTITPNLKEFQVQMMLRNSSTIIIGQYMDAVMEKVREIFPEDDPYIKAIKIGGQAPTSMEISNLISASQAKSIILSFVLVLIVTFFIFRSLVGGLYALMPLLFTVILNFGLLYFLGGEITTGTMMVASIAIGTGIDYTIHFLERFKIQLKTGEDFITAYQNTIKTVGQAIVLNAASVALGFLVLVFSNFTPNIMLGVMMAATMVFSTIGALVLLPALIIVRQPKFFTKARKNPAV